MAFPNWRRAGDPGFDQGGRLPLRLGPGDETVRPRQRHHSFDATGQGLALFLRGRLRAARRALRSDRRVGWQGRIARRSNHFLLLSIRPGTRNLRPGRDAHTANLRGNDYYHSGGAVSLPEAQGKTEGGAVEDTRSSP